MIYLYRNLKFVRKKNDITQVEIAAQCGVTQNTWSNYENGVSEPDLATLIKISDILKTPIDALLRVDLQSVEVNPKKESGKKYQNVEVNVEPTVEVNTPKKGNYSVGGGPETVTSEPDPVGTWAILGQLKRIEEKIDQLRASGDNSAQ